MNPATKKEMNKKRSAMHYYSYKPLQDLGMPSPNRNAAVSTCVELDREQSYSTSDLLTYVQNKVSNLTSEQKDIYDKIMYCVDNNVGETFFLDAPGGTSKNL